jgi:integrase/recombinase XerD
VKILRFGQATPLCTITYNQISNSFATDLQRLFLGFAWYTGERPEAILSMDVSHAYSDVFRRQPRDTVLYPASNRKDKTTREVPTHRALKLMLAAYEPAETGFLFPSLYQCNRHLSRQAMDKAFRRALKKAGLENQGYSLYSPRRGFITHLNRLGFDVKVIQKLTGHRSLSSLIRYIDVSESQLKNAIDNY